MSNTPWKPIRDSRHIELTAPSERGGKSYFLEFTFSREIGKDALGNELDGTRKTITIVELNGTNHSPEGLRNLANLLLEAVKLCEEWKS